MRSPRIMVLSLAITLLSVRLAVADGQKVPVALAWNADDMLLVALRDACQVVTFDPATWKVIERSDLPFRPISLATSDDRRTLYIGGIDGEVMARHASQNSLLRNANGKGPARVVALSKERIAVTSTWDLSVSILDGSSGATLRGLPLSFSPGTTVRRPDGRLIVADAFGGKMADVDPESGHVRTRTFDGVNSRALAISGDGKELLVGHMSQYGPVPLTGTNLDWGLILSSRLSAIPLSEFDVEGRVGEVLARRRLTLDGSAHGSADPSAMVVARDGELVLIALAGSHQILKNDRTLDQKSSAPGFAPLGNYQRLELASVGQSPLDLTLDPTGEHVVSADAMSDTLTVIRVEDLTTAATVRFGSIGERPNRTASQRGEAHFLDGKRSMDRWMSCSSCHSGGHTNGLNFDTLGDGGYGAAKNTPSLMGVGTTAPYSWTGRFATLEAQIHQSLATSMRGPTPNDEVIIEIAAYLRSLPAPPPRRPSEDPAAKRGAVVFNERQCDRCHVSPTYTSVGVKYVALDDGAGGNKSFNAPSLRGVGWSAPYLHDGRAKTLDDLLEIHPPNLSVPLSKAERESLKAFLESL